MTTIQMRSNGKITLPAKLRSKYKLQDGDAFTLLDLEDGSFLLKLGVSEVDKISAKVEKSLQEEGITLEDLFETLREVRKELFQERYGNMKKSSNDQG